MTRYQKCKPYLIILFFALLFCLPQLISKKLILGSDSIFHFNRFYETAKQIETGNYSYFISLYSFQQTGRIINALYGPMMAYFHGFLVWLSQSWFHYQVLANFILYGLSGTSMYLLLQKCTLRLPLRLTLSLTFMTTFSIQYWVVRQGFTSWGAALLPLCLIPIVDFAIKKEIHWRSLGLLTALIFQTHLFSSLLLVMIYLPFFCYAFFTTNKKRYLLLELAKAIGLFILLTVNIWLSFYEIYKQNRILPPFINHELYHNTINDHSRYWLYTPGFLVVLLLGVLLLGFFYWKYLSPLLKLTLGTSAIFFLLSTNYMPWKYLIEHNSKIAQTIQFPFRFFVPVTILTILATGLLLKEVPFNKPKTRRCLEKVIAFSLIFSSAQTLLVTSYTLSQWQTVNKFAQTGKRHTFIANKKADEIKSAFFNTDKSIALKLIEKSTPDYVPIYQKTNENKYNLYENEILFQANNFSKEVTDGKLIFQWTADESGWQEVPLIKYTKSSLTLNGKNLTDSEIKLSAIGVAKVYQQKGMNQLILGYQNPPYFWLSIVTPFVCLFFLSVYAVVQSAFWKKRVPEIFILNKGYSQLE